MPKKNWSKFAIWGFILALVSFITIMPFFLPFLSYFGGLRVFREFTSKILIPSFVLWILSIVLCSISLKNIKKEKQAGKGLAIIGLVIDAIPLLTTLIYFYFALTAVF